MHNLNKNKKPTSFPLLIPFLKGRSLENAKVTQQIFFLLHKLSQTRPCFPGFFSATQTSKLLCIVLHWEKATVYWLSLLLLPLLLLLERKWKDVYFSVARTTRWQTRSPSLFLLQCNFGEETRKKNVSAVLPGETSQTACYKVCTWLHILCFPLVVVLVQFYAVLTTTSWNKKQLIIMYIICTIIPCVLRRFQQKGGKFSCKIAAHTERTHTAHIFPFETIWFSRVRFYLSALNISENVLHCLKNVSVMICLVSHSLKPIFDKRCFLYS